MEEASYKEIAEYLGKTNSERADLVLATLGKTTQFRKALESPVGQELLKDLLFLMEERLQRIANMENTDEDRFYYKAYKSLSERWAGKISKQKRLTAEIKKVANK